MSPARISDSLESVESPVVVALLCGGLGNQMFQYATARRLAYHHDVPLKLDLAAYAGGTDRRPAGLEAFSRKYALDAFLIHGSAASAQDVARLSDPYSNSSFKARVVRQLRRFAPGYLVPKTHIREKQYRFAPEILELPADVYLQGFWQSHKYFTDIAAVIRQELSPKDQSVIRYAREYVDELRNGGGPIISVHVRRGDLVKALDLKTPSVVQSAPTSTEYVSAAMKRFDDEGSFLVFSDSAADIDWCRKNIRADRLHFSEGHSDVQDLAIMSSCDHHIIANSTFSWWAAWLNDKPGRRVIAPRVWSVPGAAYSMVVDDLIPADWELL